MRQQDTNPFLNPENARTNRFLQRTPSTNSIASVASSIGYSHCLKQRRKPSERPARKNFCSCDASQLEDELRTLRETATDILQKSWGDVETLQIQVSEQVQLMEDMKADLEKTRTLLMMSKKREHAANVSNVKLKSKLANFRHTLLCSSEDNNKWRPQKRKAMFSRNVSRHAQEQLSIARSKCIPFVRKVSMDEKQPTILSLQMKLASRDEEIKSLEDTMLQHIEILQRHPHCWSSQPIMKNASNMSCHQRLPNLQNNTSYTRSLTQMSCDKESSIDDMDFTIHSLQMKLTDRNNTISSLEEMIMRNIEILRVYPTE